MAALVATAFPRSSGSRHKPSPTHSASVPLQTVPSGQASRSPRGTPTTNSHTPGVTPSQASQLDSQALSQQTPSTPYPLAQGPRCAFLPAVHAWFRRTVTTASVRGARFLFSS